MRFHCSSEYREPAKCTWHRWFAWRPVRVEDDECVWLEFVERRAYENPNYYIGGYLWEYR